MLMDLKLFGNFLIGLCQQVSHKEAKRKQNISGAEQVTRHKSKLQPCKSQSSLVFNIKKYIQNIS